MSRNRKVLAVLTLLILIALVVYFWPRQEAPETFTEPEPTVQMPVKTLPDGRPAALDPDAAKRGVKENFGPDTNSIMAFAAALMKPFQFVGRVVDQNGYPVSNASVRWGANNNPDPNKSGTLGETTSGADGFFSVESTGIGLYVEVSKSGYDRIPSELGGGKRGSYGGFVTGGRLGNTDSPMGTAEAPSIFVLRKMGETVPLVRVTERPIKVPKDGSPVQVDLATGRTTQQGDLTVQCWTNDHAKDADGHYHWQCLLTVPGGGLIERTDPMAFEAPSDGYKPSVELGPPVEKWSSRAEREYFVRLSDNRYAQISFRMRTGGEHFFVIESYLNPEPGNRNLEFDPAKVVKTP